MGKTFFTSDTHFGHGNIIKYCHRPFLSDGDRAALEREGAWHDGDWKGNRSSKHKISHEAVEKMNQVLIDNINLRVGEDDTLWHLGDWAFAPRDSYYQKCRSYRDRIHCRNVNIIWGNHDDRCIRDLFNQAHDLVQVTVEGQKIVLCHYAMAIWDKCHRATWHLYGHSHAGAESWFDANMSGRRAFDVGVDNAYKLNGFFSPFSFEQVRRIMENRGGFSMDHHVPKNSTAPTEEELSHGKGRQS